MVFPDLLFLLRERLPAFCGLRMVAMTRPPCSAKYRVVSQPMPEDAPRIKYPPADACDAVLQVQAAETAINMVRDGIGIGIYDGNAGGRACEISG